MYYNNRSGFNLSMTRSTVIFEKRLWPSVMTPCLEVGIFILVLRLQGFYPKINRNLIAYFTSVGCHKTADTFTIAR